VLKEDKVLKELEDLVHKDSKEPKVLFSLPVLDL
jgi:hypothetical protein